ncbi:hypothetical protein K493DRAFT_403576 [Basidiobolus meristosporus CBS 931.73]|uniref:FYR N-terminal domain-containing protein n=1 Tax=Basidiobolus meristosporus CBS 931.73 TaxID=1314790 RepID=A0A1Y1ZCX1_9FUNG|nr:hypothetical protein K493DRAFT_403576 [Basidiobolus meristosporus CBS 931.73]|eukprot:ORY07817.1 hypothetical protein K493DRAFT_403576 [Basidiobolus meristosporus CBS 931.73]
MPLATYPSSKRDRSSKNKDVEPSPSPEKYKKLKQKLKEVLEEVDRLTEIVEKQERKVYRLKRENNILIERLAKLEDSDPLSEASSASEPESDLSDVPLARRSPPKRKSEKGAKESPAKATPTANSKRKSPTTASPSEPAPKKRRQKRVEVKARRVQDLPKNEEGDYILPVQVGVLTVSDLGTIVYDRSTFHNERYIWPVGYTVQRSYASMVDPESQTTYVCRISDGGEGPKFHIEPEDQPDNPIIANTATGAWTTVVKAVNTIRKREHSNSASGPDYFGFSHPTIAKMIQDLPNADQCKQYIWQEFIVMAGRGPGGKKSQKGATESKPNGKANGKTNGKSKVEASPSTPVENEAESDNQDAEAEAQPSVIEFEESEPGELAVFESNVEQPRIRPTHGGKKPLSSMLGRGGYSPMSSNDDSDEGSESESDLSD